MHSFLLLALAIFTHLAQGSPYPPDTDTCTESSTIQPEFSVGSYGFSGTSIAATSITSASETGIVTGTAAGSSSLTSITLSAQTTSTVSLSIVSSSANSLSFASASSETTASPISSAPAPSYTAPTVSNATIYTTWSCSYPSTYAAAEPTWPRCSTFATALNGSATIPSYGFNASTPTPGNFTSAAAPSTTAVSPTAGSSAAPSSAETSASSTELKSTIPPSYTLASPTTSGAHLNTAAARGAASVSVSLFLCMLVSLR